MTMTAMDEKDLEKLESLEKVAERIKAAADLLEQAVEHAQINQATEEIDRSS